MEGLVGRPQWRMLRILCVNGRTALRRGPSDGKGNGRRGVPRTRGMPYNGMNQRH